LFKRAKVGQRRVVAGMVTAFVPPPTVSDPVSVIAPLCPEPDPKVCAEVDGLVMVKLAADAADSAKKARAAIAPV
jgi:hypothetical protein